MTYRPTLQANCHIGRDAKDVILDGQIARMDDIAFADPALVFLPEFQEGLCSIVGTGLDLDGIHLVLGLAVVGDDEVDFDIVALLFLVIMGVEEQAVPVGSQDLGNHVLIEHTLVQSQFPG